MCDGTMKSLRLHALTLSVLGLFCASCNLFTTGAGSAALTFPLEGHVLAGPQCPAVRLGDSCPDQPFSASFDVYDDQQRRVAGFQSDAEGFFQISLESKTYTVVPDESAPILNPLGQPKIVTVLPDQITQVTLVFDTGIR